MAKNRMHQRENRRLKHREELLEKYSSSGYKDLTPYNAICKVILNKDSVIAIK